MSSSSLTCRTSVTHLPPTGAYIYIITYSFTLTEEANVNHSTGLQLPCERLSLRLLPVEPQLAVIFPPGHLVFHVPLTWLELVINEAIKCVFSLKFQSLTPPLLSIGTQLPKTLNVSFYFFFFFINVSAYSTGRLSRGAWMVVGLSLWWLRQVFHSAAPTGHLPPRVMCEV